MSNHKNALLALLFSIFLLILFTGSKSAGNSGFSKQDSATTVEKLTPEAARQALIEMLEDHPSRLLEEGGRTTYTLPFLKAGRFLNVGEYSEGYVRGEWNCRLATKSFHFSDGGFRGEGQLFGCSGVFECVNGKWQARMTKDYRETCHSFIQREIIRAGADEEKRP
jgi:hypothetical protein